MHTFWLHDFVDVLCLNRKFNAPGSDYFVYLISTRAGGMYARRVFVGVGVGVRVWWLWGLNVQVLQLCSVSNDRKTHACL